MTKLKAEIHTLFPTTVYRNNINRKFTKQELNFLQLSKKNIRKNIGNSSTNQSYILENNQFKNLKKDILFYINDYCENFLKINSKKIKPYITQSWLNFTNVNEFHHLHHHHNSFISGVFYVKSKKDVDKIHFAEDNKYLLRPEYTEFNIYNSEDWWLPTETGDVLLFSSKLKHYVRHKEDTNERISLAFNVFLKGEIGTKNDFTELVI